MSCPRYDVSFNGLLLNHLPYVIDDLDISPPPVTLSKYALFNRAGSVVIDSHIDERLISISGRIVKRDRVAMEAAIDKLNRYLYSGRQVLKPGFSDSRYFMAQVASQVRIDWSEGGGGYDISPRVVNWSADFLADTPFAYSPTLTTVTDNSALAADGGTDYHKDIVITPGGSAPARPRLTLTIPNPSAYGILEIVLTNLMTGATIELTRTFSQGDIFTIDADTYDSFLNYVPVQFDGTLNFLLDPSAGITNTVRISCTATAGPPTIRFDAQWYPRFL